MSINKVAENVQEINVIRTPEQMRIISYLQGTPPGCGQSKMTDAQFIEIVTKKISDLKLQQKALGKIGLDLDQVNEIPPVNFEDFVFDDAYVKQTDSGDYVSNIIQSTWLFFSAEEIYLYVFTYWLDRDKKREDTLEYFYKDITALSTSSKEAKTKTVLTLKSSGCGSEQKVANNESIESTKFQITVPGDKFMVSMKDTEDNESRVQAMKQMLREKKNA